MRSKIQGEKDMAVNERKKRTKAVIDSFPKWVVRVYVVVLTVIFPFYERNQYFSLLSDRTKFFKYCTSLMILALSVFCIIQIKKQ